MTFNILVTGGIYSSQSGYSALQFCRAAVTTGHHISQVFFYQDGVTQATNLSVPLSDELDLVSHWVDFSKDNATDLVVCVSASERRGVLNADQMQESGKPACNLHDGFRVQGLGSLHDMSLKADRTITFK